MGGWEHNLPSQELVSGDNVQPPGTDLATKVQEVKSDMELLAKVLALLMILEIFLFPLIYSVAVLKHLGHTDKWVVPMSFPPKADCTI